MKKFKLLVALIVTIGLCNCSKTGCQRTFCDPENRPQSCYDGIDPICGYFTNCKGRECRNTFGNSCSACSDSRVGFYVSGDCKSEIAPTISFCDENSRPTKCQKDTNNPVCSITDNCYGPDCYQTVQDACTACKNPAVKSYVNGECFDLTKAQKIVCDAQNRPEICGTQTEFVCAYYKKGRCPDGVCYKTLPSPCYACRNPDISHYIPGTCLQDVIEQKSFCEIENLPRPCPPPPDWLYQPVCAYLRNCEGESCRFTATYICTVCGTQGVDYYIPGECKTYCNSKTVQEFCAQDSGPVCAYPKGCTDDFCRSNLASSCVACSDSQIEYYTEGECYQPPLFPDEFS